MNEIAHSLLKEREFDNAVGRCRIAFELIALIAMLVAYTKDN
jgi:hypothetical protein